MNATRIGPADWDRAALEAWDGWRYEFSDAERRELLRATEQLTDAPRVLKQTTHEDFPLPELVDVLAGIGQELEHGCGLVVLRGMPLDQVDVTGATAMFWGLTAHLGTAVPQTAAGDRIFHVRDEGYAENHPQARGPSSRKRLSFHTDRCDVIAFCCLQQAKSGGENHVLSARRLYDEIHARRPDLAEVLQQPFYYQRHNVDPANNSAYYQQPVFSFYEGHFTGQLLRVLIERAYAAGAVPPMSSLQREALDFLEATADDPALYVEFRQEPGDVVLMNNLTTFHRRTEFEDYKSEDHAEFDRRRHLLRIWLATPTSRPLDPLFAASYGSTAAGSIRGGMRTAH